MNPSGPWKQGPQWVQSGTRNKNKKMKMKITTDEIARQLIADGNACWSYNGAKALAEYLEEYEESTGDELEFDRVAIRCDFAEWASLQEWAEDYFSDDWKEQVGIEADEDDEDEIDDKIREHITDNGQLIEFPGGVIVSSF